METTTTAAAAAGRPEIAFFDVETTVPTRSSGGYALLEFGAIVVCPSRLVEVGSYSTLIRPADLDAISALSVRCNGITRDTVANAPTFRDVADAIYGLLNGRVWAGHNIVRFDCVRIREAFAELGRPAPEPKGVIDTLPLLTQRFGRRAGNMKMASLATYFGLGQQKHRSLDDVRMNLEVVKYCATVLFLEASLPDMSSVVNSEQITTPTRIEGNGNASPDNLQPDITPPNLVSSQKRSHPMDNNPLVEDNHQDMSATFESNAYHSTLVTHMEHMKIDTLQRDTTVFACSTFKSAEMLCTTDASCSGTGFLEPDELLPQDITAPVVFSHQYGHKINLLHRDSPLQICSMGMAVRFGVSTKFTDHAGRPKLSIVVDISDNLSKVLDICDQLAQRSSESCGSSSEWRPVIRRNGYSKPSSIRLQIPIVANGDAAIYSTEMYQKDLSGNVQKFGFSKIDIAELDSLFTPGVLVDAYFCLDIYDFQQNAGIRLVAKRLVVHTRQ